MKAKSFLLVTALAIGLVSCQKDDGVNSLDQRLQNRLEALSSEGLDFFTLPASTDFSKIPQDPNNPISQEKVDLGKLLYHETGLAVNPMHPEAEGTYSCATCHFAAAGFQANRHQGIGDGGIGFSNNGEARGISSSYEFTEIDVQPIRTPTAMNGAYQINQLWNGQFGATGLNVGTEDRWPEGTPIATNTLGFEGLEIQAIAGLKVHRMTDIDETLTVLYENDFHGSLSKYAYR